MPGSFKLANNRREIRLRQTDTRWHEKGNIAARNHAESKGL